MKNLLRLEELAMFGLSVYLFGLLDYAWWVYPALLLAPDLGMVGYLLSPRLGAVTYNLAHHKGLALLVYLIGIGVASPALQLTGIILFGHASLDRIFGYGLKYPDSFQHTHLGFIGQKQPPTSAALNASL